MDIIFFNKIKKYAKNTNKYNKKNFPLIEPTGRDDLSTPSIMKFVNANIIVIPKENKIGRSSLKSRNLFNS